MPEMLKNVEAPEKKAEKENPRDGSPSAATGIRLYMIRGKQPSSLCYQHLSVSYH